MSQISIEAPYQGGTIEGFKLGDLPATYNKIYNATADKLLPNNSLSRRDTLGTTLDIIFDAEGKATHITLAQDNP